MKTDNGDFFTSLEKVAPECFYKFKYPYSFKFDLILDAENYGQIEVVVKEGLDISEIKGTGQTLKKLNEINKKGSSYYWEVPPSGDRIMHYPVVRADELAALLGKFCLFHGEDAKFTINGEFEAMLKFIANVYHPINTGLLYQKTGIFMTD